MEASDALDLPEDLDPRGSGVQNAKINFRSQWTVLKSLILVRPGEAVWCLSLASSGYLLGLVFPALIHRFITLVDAGMKTPEDLQSALWLAFAFGAVMVIRSLSFQHYFFYSVRLYQFYVTVLSDKIFKASLQTSLTQRNKTTIGDIINYMSSDTESTSDFGVFGDLVGFVIQVTGVVALLVYYLGWSSVPPIMTLALLIPATKRISKRLGHFEEDALKKRDNRVTLLTQVLNSIRVVKYFSWEKSVIAEVTAKRNEELASRQEMGKTEVMSGISYMFIGTVVLFVALVTHVLRGHELSPALVFTLVALFGTLEDAFGSFSWILYRSTSAVVGARRISEFIRAQDLPENIQSNLPISNQAAVGVEVENLHVKWSKEDRVLYAAKLEIAQGESVAIVGPVGSGKSSLLQAIFGETIHSEGRISYVDSAGKEVRGRISYVPQEAYILNTTVYENVMFGNKSEGDLDFEKVIRLASFQQDLEQFPNRERTEIGEKGVNLSGGQKQRLGLARAILQRPQLVLLDDPLSAVDVHTEEELVDNLIFDHWKDVTRLVVTHRVEHLGRFDRILFVENGNILGDGSLEELLKSNPRFKEFLGAQTSKTELGAERQALPLTEFGDGRITQDEDREKGTVHLDIYKNYFLALGGERNQKRNLFLMFFGVTFSVSFALLQKAWLSYSSQNSLDSKSILSVFAVIGIVTLLTDIINGRHWLHRSLSAGRLLHERMLKSLIKTHIRFFDSTPIGRIVQRFSRDVESVDVHIRHTIFGITYTFFSLFIELLMLITLLPIILFFILPLFYIYYKIQDAYRKPAREIKRLDSVARSPRYAHFKETLSGLSVIRGYAKQEWFLSQFHEHLAHSQRMYYSHFLINRWFSVRVPLIGAGIAMATAFAVIWTTRNGVIGGGVAGLVMIYSMNFWGQLNQLIRMFSDVESRMTSVERLQYYAKLTSEELPNVQDQELKGGTVEFKNIWLRYDPSLPWILKNLSFRLENGKHIAFIGRTGSGKSTIFQAIYRMVNAERGSIEIGGVDTSTVPLEILRKSLAIVPQDPVLFIGTLRQNIDRYSEYSDDEVISVLKKVRLWDFVSRQSNTLETFVAEGGANFSQGQRQLLCLARALLLKAKVVMFDEATASVDVETDGIIQSVIRAELKGTTLLMIAHRLESTKDCDQVIELSQGVVV